MAKAEQLAMFPEPPHEKREGKQAAARSVAWGACPNHVYTYKLVGIVRGGRHLYWREHKVPVNGPRKFRWCTGSNAPLCVVSARTVPGHSTPHCICETSL